MAELPLGPPADAAEGGNSRPPVAHFRRFDATQYSATGLPGEPVAPFIFSGDHTNRNS